MKYSLAALAAAGLLVGTPAIASDGQALAQKHACMSCHQVDKKVVGPAFKDVAAKYKGDKTAEAKLVDKVKKGGSGVWGTIPMPPNPQVPEGDVKAVVAWILAIK
jgi:cytochrome c